MIRSQPLKKSRGPKALILAILTIVCFSIYFQPLRLFQRLRQHAATYLYPGVQKVDWVGWAAIENMVVFGDSLTSTGYHLHGPKPSMQNPIGNPEFPGKTSAIGPNWVSYLTNTYNETFLKSLNLATGGATIDGDVIEPMPGLVRTFKDQVLKNWLPNYVPPSSELDWRANNTLFVTFIGNNDVSRAYVQGWVPSLEADLQSYIALLGSLYDSGARNFLVMNVPPLERAPLFNQKSDRWEVAKLHREWNNNLARSVRRFSNTHPDSTVLVFDTYGLFNQLIDEPCSYEETCPLQETVNFCEAYRHEHEDQYKFDPICHWPADKYFWLNTLHFSSRVHHALARSIVEFLKQT